jgi:hypothetical protein
MYFAGRIAATVLLADAAGVVLILVAAGMDGLHLTAVTIGGRCWPTRSAHWR